MSQRRDARGSRTGKTPRRRTFLQVCSAGVITALAGCSGSGGSGPYDGWLSNANGFQSVQDRTDESSIEIGVGTDGGLAFDPVAVRISPGTEVVWKWTGAGGSHNVRDSNGAFESELTDEEGHTFTQTLETVATYKYVCEPHQGSGMKGVIEVVDS